MKYSSIFLEKLEKLEKVKCDVYIKLSEKKYIKIIKKNHEVSLPLIQKYKDKGVDEFYVHENDYEVFYKDFQNYLKSLNAQKTSNWRSKVGVSLESVKVAHDVVESLGVNQVVIDSIDEVTSCNIDFIKKKEKTVFDVLNEMILGNNYRFERCLLISYICAGIYDKLDWEVEGALEKLSIAAMLHDVGLKNENLLKLKGSRHEMDSLSEEEREEYKFHPRRSEAIVKTSKQLPLEVDQLVLRHHESPDGSGFPMGLSANQVTQLNALFIIAVDFGTQLHGIWPNAGALKKVMEDFSTKYNVGNYRKPLEALKKLIPDF